MTTTAYDTRSTIEALRAEMIAAVNNLCDRSISGLLSKPSTDPAVHKSPTLEDGHDARNKNGYNLTPRGVEILFRVFDEGGGYNKAAKMLIISQSAAKNRKQAWIAAGGNSRNKMKLDIDES